MQNDDELVEKVARGIFEARSWWMDDPRSWGRLSKDNKSKYLDDASAAIAVMREAGYVKQPPGKLPMWTDDPNRCVSGATFPAISK